MTEATIRAARREDLAALGEMMAALWPEGPCAEHESEAAVLLETGNCGTLPGAILVAHDEGGSILGFLQIGLRSHVDGCDVANAVGFIEGWFVRPEVRGQGVGRSLVEAGEAWARAQGCVEMGSDALIDNLQSQNAHRALGFTEVDRCVHFRKRI
jgi:aminoglycoside 6'-N-acetyltransferase I